MPHRRFLRQLCALSQVLVHWRLWRMIMAVTLVCLMSEPLARAQEPGFADKPATTKVQPATEPQVRDRDKLLTEHQRLRVEEKKHAEVGMYAEAIKTSRQRESVLLEVAKLPDRKADADQARRDMLLKRESWQWLSGQIVDAVQTSEQRLQLIEAEFGIQHWQSANARFALDYNRKLAATDEPTRHRMRQLEQQGNAASARGNFSEAITKADAFKDLEAQVLGVGHPSYANSLGNIAGWCLQTRDYERANREWQAALTIRRKAYGDAHPDVLACHDGLAAVARQQRHWDAAHTHYDLAAAPRRQLFGTMSPKAPTVWLDDFATDSLGKYTVSGDVRWESGQITLSPGATVGRRIATGCAWEARLDLVFPPASPDGKPSISRFEFTLAGAASTYALVWKTEQQAGQPRTRLQFVTLTPKPAGQAGPVVGENVKVLREAEWPHDPSGRWSLSWTSGLLQVRHDDQPVFEGYVENDADCSAWAVRSSVGSLAVIQLKLHGVAIRTFSTEATSRLTQTQRDNQTIMRLFQEGKFSDATKLAESVLETRRGLLGEDDPDTATSVNNLAGLYESQANYAAAEPLYQRALKIKEKALGSDHPNTATR